MAASSTDLPADLNDVNANYSVGNAMTYEQMMKQRQSETEYELHNPFEEKQETNPYVFEDKPIGARRYALLNLVGPGLPQTHEGGKTFIKLKGATTTINQAKTLANALHEREEKKYGIYLTELFKFICLPPPPADVSIADADVVMNECIKRSYNEYITKRDDFNTRKKAMMDDLARQNKITERIAAGELPAEAADSKSLFPETQPDHKEEEDRPGESMEKDIPTSSEHYVVIATLLSALPWADKGVIYKLCGVFETEEKAVTHMKDLKRSSKYKLFDVTVAEMYSWLEMPPPYEVIENVHYDSNKLTEALGQRKQTIEIDQSGLHEPADLT